MLPSGQLISALSSGPLRQDLPRSLKGLFGHHGTIPFTTLELHCHTQGTCEHLLNHVFAAHLKAVIYFLHLFVIQAADLICQFLSPVLPLRIVHSRSFHCTYYGDLHARRGTRVFVIHCGPSGRLENKKASKIYDWFSVGDILFI